MRQETKQSIFKAAVNGQKYDESCKDVFKHREIIAPILKYTVKEFMDCSQEEIIQCIDADSIKEIVPVDELPPKIIDRGTELSSVFEKTIYYDVHFKAKNPKLSNEMISVMLHIDFEVQNDYRPHNPKYPIIKRAIYYASREISSQLSALTQKTNYADLEKIYSIWVCNENIPLNLQNTLTRYTLKKEDIIGQTSEPEEDYDLIEIIIIRRGSEAADDEIFQYLESIFTSNINKIKEFIDIPSGSGVEKEISHMAGLGESLYNKAYNKAYTEAYNEAYNEAYDKASKDILISILRKNYLRGNCSDSTIILQDLQEELNISYEEAMEIFENEIKMQ